jgi:hypothetical protein
MCSFQLGYCQDSTCKLKLSNANISYTIYRYGMDFTSNYAPKSNMVIETNIKDTVYLNKLKNLKVEQWLCLLNNLESDWAANLLLYQFYEKDAILFSVNKKREGWIGFRKEEDLKYWKTFLEK